MYDSKFKNAYNLQIKKIKQITNITDIMENKYLLDLNES